MIFLKTGNTAPTATPIIGSLTHSPFVLCRARDARPRRNGGGWLNLTWKIEDVEPNNLPGLTPVALIVLATALALLFPLSVPFLVGSTPLRPADWLGFAGSILTSGVAFAAVMVAWRNISRQMRANFLSREEDRIEDELPGLRDTEDRLATMLSLLEAAGRPQVILEILRPSGLLDGEGNLSGAIDRAFPRANEITRRRLTEHFFDLRNSLSAAVATERLLRLETSAFFVDDPSNPEATSLRQQLDEQWPAVMRSIGALRQFQIRMVARLEIMTTRLPRIRAEIESRIDV